MDSQRSHVHQHSGKLSVLFSKWKSEVVDLDEIHIEDALRVEKDEISSDQHVARSLHTHRPVAWQDLGLDDLLKTN